MIGPGKDPNNEGRVSSTMLPRYFRRQVARKFSVLQKGRCSHGRDGKLAA
jgi:hypothetical protein